MIALYGSLIRVTLMEAVQYRFSIVVWLLGRVIQPVVYLSVWNAIARANGGAVGGYTARDFAAYYILLTIAELWTTSSNVYQLPRAIQTGALSQKLLKPLHPLHHEVCSLTGQRILDTAIMLPAMVLLAFLFRPDFTCTPATLLMAVPALFFASALRFMVEAWVGFSAFWIVRTTSFSQVYFLFLFFFSGQAAPNGLLPGIAQTCSLFLPFQWMMQFPVDVALGRLGPEALVRGFTFQAGWLAFGAFFTRFLWRRGLESYTAVGS